MGKQTRERRLPKNAMCPCGSGKKYGKCCYNKDFQFVISKSGAVVRRLPLAPELKEILQRSEEEFKEIFGRKQTRGDLVHFSQFLSGFDESDELLEQAARKAKVREPVIFATRRTGFIVGKDSRKIMPEIDYREWEDAIDEYNELESTGVDPFHVFTYLTGEEFEKFKACVTLLKSILVIGFNSIRKCGDLKKENEFFQYLITCSALNSYRTIYDMFNHRYDDDCLAILRGIYEQYLRIMGLRLRPDLAERFNALIYTYIGHWHHKVRKNGTLDYSVVVDPEDGKEIRTALSNFALVSLSDFELEATIYGEIYNELSGHVHHDVTLWALKTLMNRNIAMDRDQDRIRAIISIIFISTLLFRELLKSKWISKRARRDLKFCLTALARGLLDFLQTENVRTHAGVPMCMVPALHFVRSELTA